MLLALVGAAAVTTSIGLTALPAAAHDSLLESDPAAASTIAVVPELLSLGFNDDVMDISAFVIVRDEAGEVFVNTEATVDGPTVTAPLPADLPDGTYSVAWRVISADGAPVQGSFEFAVAAAVAAAAEASPPVAAGSAAQGSAAGSAAGSDAAVPVADGDGAAGRGTAGYALPSAAALVVALLVGTALVVRVRRRRPPGRLAP